MGYGSRMNYGNYGDYMAGYAGDPGFFSKLFKIGKSLVSGFIGGGAPQVVQMLAPPRAAPAPFPMPVPLPFPGIGPISQGVRAIRRRSAARMPGEMPKRRRMNVANPKALRRALRRQQGFVKLARRALKGSGYTIVARGSRRPSIRVQEAGSGGVTIQK